MLFLEHDVQRPEGNRIDRWHAAHDVRRDCGVPFVMIDSGWRWTCGQEDFTSVYRSLVNQALQHPAGADVLGYYLRSGNNLDVWMQVTNRSGTTLGPANAATANVIVFERTKVIHTERFVRAAASSPLTSDLPHGGMGSYRVQLTNLPMGQWDRAVIVVLLDYRPDPSSRRFEAVQAAIAVEVPPASPTPPFTATPTPTDTPAVTPTPLPTETPTPSPTATVTATGEPSPTRTATPDRGRAYLPALWRGGNESGIRSIGHNQPDSRGATVSADGPQARPITP